MFKGHEKYVSPCDKKKHCFVAMDAIFPMRVASLSHTCTS